MNCCCSSHVHQIITPHTPPSILMAATAGLVTMFCWACLDNLCDTGNDGYRIVDAIFFTLWWSIILLWSLWLCDFAVVHQIYMKAYMTSLQMQVPSVCMHNGLMFCTGHCLPLPQWIGPNKWENGESKIDGWHHQHLSSFPFNTSSYLVSSYSSNLLPYHLMILWVCAKYLLESWGWVQFSVLTRKDIVSCCFPCFPSPQLKRKKLSPYMCSWRRVQGGQIHLHNYPLHRV